MVFAKPKSVISEAPVIESLGTLAEAKDGIYSGEAQGFGNKITADVTIKSGVIADVKVSGPGETPNLGSVAVDMIPSRVVDAQSIKVDTISGATVSSRGVLNAIKNALAVAGVDPNGLRVIYEGYVPKVDKTLEVDVVVVGAGGAGMTAAITLQQEGKSVIILEKMPYVGGNTIKATGGMNAAETHYQAEAGIKDSIAQFVEDTMVGGHQVNDIKLVKTMAKFSAKAIEWLDSIGAPLPKVSFSGGATNARIHSPADGSGVGEYLVESYKETLDKLGIEVLLNTEATNIVMNNGKAVGVLAEDSKTYYTINSKAVIIATGGFGANEDMITEYRADLKGTVTTNGDTRLYRRRDIEQIQLHPTVEQSTSILITEGVRGDGAILVNQSGVRFTNELLTRDKVSAAELKQEGCYAYVIFDQNLREGLKASEKYVKAGIVTEAQTVEELATKLGIDPTTLAKTVSDWNAIVASGNDYQFGRTTGMEHDLSKAPYYAIKIAPGIHHTMGGVKIDTETHVIDTDGNIIPGLYAAGEVVGGVHGGNRIGGNAVADIVVFGRIAGQEASNYVDAQ